MAKYIKQEMNDLQKTGEQKSFYRMKIERNIDAQEFVEHMCHPGSGLSRGVAISVLVRAADTLASLLANGYSVSLDEWGTFKATIGLEKDKEMDTFDGDETKRNARSLRLTGINYRADKVLIREANRHCKLERAGEARLHHSPYSKEERLKLALQYLEEHGTMRVVEYMELTGLSRTKAAMELKEFRQDLSSGITFIGRGSAKVYVKASEEKKEK